jgi:hypothetical protein
MGFKNFVVPIIEPIAPELFCKIHAKISTAGIGKCTMRRIGVETLCRAAVVPKRLVKKILRKPRTRTVSALLTQVRL